MATVAYDVGQHPLSFHDALEQAELLARQHLPQVLHERLSCAVALVKGGHVLQLDDGHTWEVDSTSTPGKVYSINGAGCPCEDAHFRAPKGYCKHTLATLLARKSLVLMGARTTAPQPEMTAADPHDTATAGDLADVMPTTRCAGSPASVASLGEAPASCNVCVMIGGHKVQVTLRDSDEQRMLERLQTLLERYPAAPAQPASAPHATTPQTPAVSETPVCLYHGPMKASTKAVGTFYCPSKMGDGSYCKERHPKA
jgi:hypothetical protein